MGLGKERLKGVIFIAIFASLAIIIAQFDAIASLGFSPLVVGIVLGIVYANTIGDRTPESWQSGITFSAKKILRLAIVLYGFRITFQEIVEVGLEGFLVSLIMLSTTMVLGIYFGYKLFGLDKKSAILSASGASVCGAAAVIATEPVVKGESHQVALAVSMVVLFGTIAMFTYPILYEFIIKPAEGFLHMDPKTFGIYVGGTVHEVAQVVAIPGSIPGASDEMAHAAVIVKMTRVILIAPMLIVLGIFLSLNSGETGAKHKLVIPWFAVYFIAVAGFNSLHLLPQSVVDIINGIDTFMLTMAMTALGVGTALKRFRGFGLAPLYTAGAMFVWLVVGGFVITKLVVAL